MIDLAKLRTWDDPGETICADAAAEIDRLLRACKDKTELLQAAYEQLSNRNHEIERLLLKRNHEIERLRADALHWAEHESDTWKAMKAENVELRASLNRLLLNYGAALPEGKKDQRSIAEARALLGLDERQEDSK